MSSSTIDWKYAANLYLCKYALTNDKFMTEDFRAWAEGQGLPVPNDLRAYGPVMRQAEREGIVRRVGYGRARSSNLSPKCIWRAAA